MTLWSNRKRGLRDSPARLRRDSCSDETARSVVRESANIAKIAITFIGYIAHTKVSKTIGHLENVRKKGSNEKIFGSLDPKIPSKSFREARGDRAHRKKIRRNIIYISHRN